MRLVSILALAFAVVAPSSSMLAQEGGIDPPFPPPKTVLELYTSQGCDTCPPADAILKSYAQRDDVIALTIPVDIWDYLGWKDTLASEKNSERQKVYAKTRGDGAIYTPQLIVNGMMHVSGRNPRDIEKAILLTDAVLKPIRVPIRFWHQRNTIYIEAGAAPADTNLKSATIWLAVVQKSAKVPIDTGDNKGKTLTYTNVVREMTPVGQWNGKAMSIQLARNAIMRPDTQASVVLLQEGRAGPILGAAWTGLW